MQHDEDSMKKPAGRLPERRRMLAAGFVMLLVCMLSSVMPLMARAKAADALLQIPVLAWEQRSDWLNVKTFGAKGDGIADDTAALQAALDKLSEKPGEPNTVYLPPGTYRITRTIAVKQRDGISIIGCGRATRIAWDGPGGTGDDARMFWSNGAPRSRYVGITWDGQHRAYVGFDHDSKGYFETEIDHQHEAFFNFTGSGIRIGHNQNMPGAQATAETTYANCLFAHCEAGLTLMQFNDYNHTLCGCEFRDCGIGVNSIVGANFYLRDSHFAGSRVVDVRVRGEHGMSVRRCTSTGSRMFIDEATIAPLTVEDCQVSGWTNPAGAVRLGFGPVVLFDCAFTKPPSRHPPIVASTGQRLILSANKSDGTDGLLKSDNLACVTEIPAGKLGGSLTSAQQTFLQDTADIPGKVFDAKRDFGARGDGKADDTAAIQAAIEAARKHGNRAIAYLPSGDYVVSKTIEVAGQDYYLGGSGIRSRLLWRGPDGGVLVHVHDPKGVTMENLSAGDTGGQKNAIDILQTGSGTASRMHYQRIWVFGMYVKRATTKGLQCRNLPSGTTIVADHFNGNLRFTDCADANLLFNTSFEGAIFVEGRSPQRRGLLGFMTRLATINICGLSVSDSQNIVMSDYYVESADRLMELSGSAGDPAGRITIGMAKSHCLQNPAIHLENYHGRVALGPSMFYPGGINPAIIALQGANPCDFILMACEAYEVTPKFAFGASARRTLVENAGKGMAKNELPAGALDEIAASLDDLRRLGELDLAANYSILNPEPGKQVGRNKLAQFRHRYSPGMKIPHVGWASARR